MPAKEFRLSDELTIKVYKRRTNRSLRLSITPTGEVRVTIPAWAPYRAGYEFAKSRQAWIEEQRTVPNRLNNGQAIGKAHRLELIPTANNKRIRSRLLANTVVVKYPQTLSETSQSVQSAAQTASIKALRAQSVKLLPQRLRMLAESHDFTFTSVNIKRLKGRWGSCDSRGRIILNLYLMQLPWDLIDYVLLHELCHTRILKHGPEFWHQMEEVLPNTKKLRKELKQYHPVLDGSV